MRIATSTIYSQQASAIDNQAALYAVEGQQLSSGKSLNEPSDNPAQIGMDLTTTTAISTETQQNTNVTGAVNELTTTDGALSGLTSLMQNVRQIAVQGATETLTDSQRADLVTQLNEALQQAVAIGNTSYGGKYIFGGTASNGNPPVQTFGNPPAKVTFTGNQDVQGQLIYNGQKFALSTTFQAAFNYGASDNSPDVFQTIINLRNELTNQTATDTSTSAINAPNQVVGGATSAVPTKLNTPGAFATTPQADDGVPPQFTIEINSTVNGAQSVKNFTFAPGAAIDDGIAAPPGTSVVQVINAAYPANQGVQAKYDQTTQKFTLTSPTGSFYVTDIPTPGTGATKAGNLTSVLNLNSQADWVNNVSTQLGDIDNASNVVLNARAVIGARIQALGSIGSQIQTTQADNQKVQSGIEDVDVAQVTTQFSQTQTALQAAYATTTRLESKTLFDYLS